MLRDSLKQQKKKKEEMKRKMYAVNLGQYIELRVSEQKLRLISDEVVRTRMTERVVVGVDPVTKQYTAQPQPFEKSLKLRTHTWVGGKVLATLPWETWIKFAAIHALPHPTQQKATEMPTHFTEQAMKKSWRIAHGL